MTSSVCVIGYKYDEEIRGVLIAPEPLSRQTWHARLAAAEARWEEIEAGQGAPASDAERAAHADFPGFVVVLNPGWRFVAAERYYYD